MNQLKKYISVVCIDCEKCFSKRKDSIRTWGGRCKSCRSKKNASSGTMKEIMRKNGIDFFKKYKTIPNGNRFKKGEMSGKKSPTWKGGKPKCIDCNIQLKSYRSKRCSTCYAKTNKGVPRSQEIKEKCRQNAPSGENHWNWNSGSSSKNTLIRMSAKYKDWRKAIFERDDYTCQMCGTRSGENKKVILNADHIKPFSLYPELIFEITNGRTLCVDCHRKTDTFGVRLTNKFRKTILKKRSQLDYCSQ